MKRTLGVVSALALLGIVAASSVTLAGPECEKACKKGDQAKLAAGCEKACGNKSACDGKTACDIGKKLNLPSLTFRVGDFQTACSTTAKNVAESNGEALAFLVDGKCYKDKGKAATALTAAIDKRASEMLQVRFVVGKDCVSCPNAAASLAKSKGTKVMYRVAGHEFACDKKAEKVAQRAREAAKLVSMQYKVGDQCLSCPNAAGALAKSKGKKMQFVIGERSTACPIEAKLLTAQAKAQAIYLAGEEQSPADAEKI